MTRKMVRGVKVIPFRFSMSQEKTKPMDDNNNNNNNNNNNYYYYYYYYYHYYPLVSFITIIIIIVKINHLTYKDDIK